MAAANKTEKTYNAKDFAKKMGGVTKKFNSNVANMDSTVFAPLPKGTYTVEVHPAVFKDTRDGDFMVRVPFTVVEGPYAKRRDAVTVFIKESQTVKEGDYAGTPFGVLDVTRNAKNLGVDTSKMKTFDKVLEGLEEVTSIEGLKATVVVSERTYTPTQGKNKGKEVTATSAVFSGLVDVGDESSEESGDSEEEDNNEEETSEEEETAEEETEERTAQFSNKEKVKFKKGRVVSTGIILKVNDPEDDDSEFTYSVKSDKDKKVYTDIPESDIESV